MTRESRTAAKRAGPKFPPKPRDVGQRGTQTKRLVQPWWGLIALLIIGVGSLLLTTTRPNPSPTSSATAQELLKIRDDDWIRGNRTAPVVLIEYIDFECPACAAYHSMLRKLESELGRELAIVPRHFPLAAHMNSMPAALAAEAAGRQGKYWQMHDLLFESQGEWGNRKAPDSAQFVAYAESIGLDLEQFANDRANPQVMLRIEQHLNEARALKVSVTPTFFVNGQAIRTSGSSAELRMLIERERRKAPEAKDKSG